jgi:hypothetical protein
VSLSAIGTPSTKYHVPSTKCQVPRAKYQVPSTKCQVPSAKCQVPSAKYQVPSTKYQVPSTKYQVPSTKYQVPSTKYQVPSTNYQVPSTKYQVPSTKHQVTSSIPGDLLNNYCLSDDLMSISRIVFVFTVLLTYPLECFVAREVVKNLFETRFTVEPDTIKVIADFITYQGFFKVSRIEYQTSSRDAGVRLWVKFDLSGLRTFALVKQVSRSQAIASLSGPSKNKRLQLLKRHQICVECCMAKFG